MRINVLRKVCCSIVAFAAFTAMVTSCGTADTGIPVSSELNVTTSDTVAESSESSTELSVDKVIATGIELIDYGQNLKGIKVYRDEREIDGMLYLPDGNGPFPVCFFAQGLGAPSIAYEDIAESLAENGIAAVLIDYPADDGKYSYVTEAEDLMAVVDGVTSYTFIYCRNIFLWGHSFGGLTVTYAGCEYFPYYEQKFKGLILLEPSFEQSPDMFAKMPQFGGKVLILTGTADNSVSLSHPDLIDRAKDSFKNADIRAIEGEDHYFTGAGRAAMIQATLDFIFNSMEKE